MTERVPPKDWPIDRKLEDIETKLAPFEDYGDYQKRTDEELKDRLGKDGIQLMFALDKISSFMMDSDMTVEEAIECVEYELSKYG